MNNKSVGQMMRALTGDGDDGEGGGQAMAMRETKRVRVSTAMVMTTRVAGNKAGDSNTGKSNGNGNKGGR
jgi:hypothetical protein